MGVLSALMPSNVYSDGEKINLLAFFFTLMVNYCRGHNGFCCITVKPHHVFMVDNC